MLWSLNYGRGWVWCSLPAAREWPRRRKRTRWGCPTLYQVASGQSMGKRASTQTGQEMGFRCLERFAVIVQQLEPCGIQPLIVLEVHHPPPKQDVSAILLQRRSSSLPHGLLLTPPSSRNPVCVVLQRCCSRQSSASMTLASPWFCINVFLLASVTNTHPP